MAAAQHLKLWEGMLGKQVAGSPWSNARHLQKDQAASAVSLFPTSMQTKRHEVHQIHGTNGEKLGGKTWKTFRAKYTEKLEKNWEEHGSRAFRAHVAPRVKSRFAVGASRRGRSPKMLKTCSLPTT